jgi:membrane-associated protein
VPLVRVNRRVYEAPGRGIKPRFMPNVVDLIASIPDSPRGILRFMMDLLLAHGYVVIFVGAALDNFGLPASGDVVLFAGGWFSNIGQAALPLVMLWGFAGALVSDNAVYWIGRIGGRPLIIRVLKMRFLHFLINEKNLARVESYFEAHGGKMVFVGRFGPGLRSMTPLFAGVSRMKYYKFLPYNLSAAAVWALAYTLVGYAFGAYWSDLLTAAKSFGYGIIALVFRVLIALVLRRRRRMTGRGEGE